MSFILDALKKSELERQRQAIPGLMDSRPVPPRTRFPLWAAALIALLAVNLVVLAIFLTRSRPHGGPGDGTLAVTAAAPTASPTVPAASPPRVAAVTGGSGPGASAPTATGALAASAASRDHFSPMDPAPADSTPVYAPEIPAEQGSPPPSGEQRHSPAVRSASNVPHRVSRLPDPVLNEDADKPDDEVLPSVSQINLAGQQALPELHLDVHVFATRPAERFVYINMRKYREGQTLAEGPVLERIRRDGVVLNYNGLRFVLPRQQ